jgi:hypothetical protein
VKIVPPFQQEKKRKTLLSFNRGGNSNSKPTRCRYPEAVLTLLGTTNGNMPPASSRSNGQANLVDKDCANVTNKTFGLVRNTS